MPALYLTDPSLGVALEGDYLEVRSSDPAQPPLRRVPLLRIEHLVTDERVDFPLAVAAGLAARGIPVTVTRRGGPPCTVVHAGDMKAEVRKTQLAALTDPEGATALARTVVAAKIRNQRRLLQRLAAHRGPDFPRPACLPAMAELATATSAAQDAASLRGLEGRASLLYFDALSAFFPADSPFHGRNRRPPRDNANALLSFGYALVTNEITLALRTAGLEPGWGFLHAGEDGRPALSLDLLEPYRPVITDALALDLLNHRRLTSDHFTGTPETGVRLAPHGRRLLFAAFEEKMTREFTDPDTGEKTCFRARIRNEAYALRRTLAAHPLAAEKGYLPFLAV